MPSIFMLKENGDVYGRMHRLRIPGTDAPNSMEPSLETRYGCIEEFLFSKNKEAVLLPGRAQGDVNSDQIGMARLPNLAQDNSPVRPRHFSVFGHVPRDPRV